MAVFFVAVLPIMCYYKNNRKFHKFQNNFFIAVGLGDCMGIGQIIQ